MSCAACSSRVEKAVSKVPGVESCSVSLLTNSMGVEGTASPEAVIAAVEAAGYGASCKGRGAGTSSGSGNGGSGSGAEADLLEDTETPVLKKRLIWSIIFFHGAYDVGMAGAGSYGGQPRGHGTFAVALDSSSHGDQPEVFHQRFSESVAQSA